MNAPIPADYIPTYELGWLPKCVAIAVLAALVVWFGGKSNAALSGGPMRIVRLELAPTVAAADRFMHAWKCKLPETWRQQLNDAQRWDTWLICSYAPLCALLCWISAEYLVGRWPGWGRVGFVLAVLQLVAGALDFVDNAGMQPTIDAGYARWPWPTIAATASSIKWLLLLLFAAYVIGAGVHWIMSVGRHLIRIG